MLKHVLYSIIAPISLITVQDNTMLKHYTNLSIC